MQTEQRLKEKQRRVLAGGFLHVPLNLAWAKNPESPINNELQSEQRGERHMRGSHSLSFPWYH